MPDSHLLDIIIVNFNSTDSLLGCLGSIYDFIAPTQVKVFVQDNGSDDDVDRIIADFPEVRLSKNKCNMGFARAVNVALKKCYAPYAVILNPDTLVTDGFFQSCLQYLEDKPEVGLLGPKILNPDGTVQGSARSFPTLLTPFFGRTSLLTKWFPNNRITRQNLLTSTSDGITPMEVDWVSGACMMVRKAAIDDIGPLDERFFLYWEDADWCKRMWVSGWKVVYYPRAAVMHYVGGSSEKLPFRSTVEFHRSAYRLFAKHAEGAQRVAKPVTMWALALRLLFSLSWYALYHWSGRTRGHMQLKNSPPPDA